LFQNQTLGSLSREARAKTEDPVKLAVEQWVEGKEKNVRALLSSLEQILWPDAKWKPVSMATVRGEGGEGRGKCRVFAKLMCGPPPHHPSHFS
jgi:hypothetical protein